MSDNCKDCRDGILNAQKSRIGDPSCNDDCPTETSCEGKQTYTDCVGVNVSLPCIGTTTSDKLTTVLQEFDTKLCQINEENCTVKVSGDDECCAYLEDKITAGTGISITKLTANPSNCQSLQISVNPGSLVWNNIPLTANFSTIVGYQIPQYSDPDVFGRVWFRGSFTFLTNIPIGSISVLNSSALPLNSRPLFIRTFFNGKGGVTGTISPQVLILNNGSIQVKNTTNANTDNKGIVSFDGFWIDTN